MRASTHRSAKNRAAQFLREKKIKKGKGLLTPAPRRFFHLAPLARVPHAHHPPVAPHEDAPHEPKQRDRHTRREQRFEEAAHVAHVHPSALVTAAAIASACCFIISSDSASTITRHSDSVPE